MPRANAQHRPLRLFPVAATCYQTSMEHESHPAESGGFRHVTAIYVTALSLIALLSLGTHFIADAIIGREQATAKVVNISGRQRMLSQRIAELSLELSRPTDADGAIAERLGAAIRLMAESHRALTHGSADLGIGEQHSFAIDDIYFNAPIHLDRQVASYLALAESYQRLPTAKRAESEELKGILAAAHQPILAALDLAVKQYERDSEQAIGRLRLIMLGMMVVMLSALTAEALFIFRPLFARLKKSQRALLESAQTDPLTGCMNRRHILDLASREFDRARRYKSSLAVMMFDIDRFKSINDTYGHAAGDEAILTFTREILAGIRSTDLFGRIGGEEFILLLPETSAEQAVAVAEKLRARVAAAGVRHEGRDFTMTVSIGVDAATSDDTVIFDALARADRHLYAAKAAGRDRVVAG